MSRKSFFIPFLFGIIIIVIVYTLPVKASQFGRDNPPERLRPDQYSYHGKEDIPALLTQLPLDQETQSVESPVGQWSKMSFESYVGNNWEIYYANGDFTNLVRLTNNDNIDDIHPRLNRGCTRIAFASFEGTNYEIYTMNVDGSNKVRLMLNGADDVNPAWSPDGTRIAFQSYRDGNAEVYVMNADGSMQTNLTNSGDYDGEPTWSPDGNHIAFISRRTGGYRIYVMNSDGSNTVMLSQQPYSESPVWSPDGSQIGYDADSDNDGWQELWSMNADGSNQTLRIYPSTNITYWANGWSPDGMWLTYTAIHMVYYYGNWYWDYAGLYEISSNGFTTLVNPYRDADWKLDWTTADLQPPITGLNAMNSPLPYKFTVSWWGKDDGAGMGSYEVQVRDGLSGLWTDWQTWTNESSGIFTGVGGHDYYFRVRGRDQGFSEQPWPTDYQVSTQVESSAPFSRVRNLDPLIYGNQATLIWQGGDIGGSGIQSYDLQFKQDSNGVWENWLSGSQTNTGVFVGEPGHTYYFRSRARDNALNLEAWPTGSGDTSTSFYSWRTLGTVSDNTGIPIAGADVFVDPPAFITFPSDIHGFYSAYLGGNPPVKSVTLLDDKYGASQPTEYGTLDANVDIYLPPLDNQIQDPGFESGVFPPSWNTGGSYTPTLDNKYYHSGSYAASLGISPQLTAPALIGNAGNIDDSFDPFAVDQHGGVHIAWGYWDNGSFIYYAHRLPDGTWLPVELAAQPVGNLWSVKLAIDGYDIVHLIYVTDAGVYYVWRDVNGTWSSPYHVSLGGWLSRMLIDTQSTIHLIIPVQTGLIYAYLPHAGDWHFEVVPSVDGPTTRSDFAVDSSGTIHLVWTIFFGNEKVFYMTRLNDGVWSNPVVISYMSSPYFVNILLDSADTPHVVWRAGDVPQLYYSSLNQYGTWSTPYMISAGTSASMYHFFIDNRDTLYTAWTDTRWDNPNQAVYFSQQVSDGQWSIPYKISNSDGSPAGDVDATAINGNVYVVWSEDHAGIVDDFYSSLFSGIWNPPQMLSVDHISSPYPRIIKDAMGAINIAWGGGGLYYVGFQPITQSGDAWVSQSFAVPITMTNPTLSFLASLSGVSDISGKEFSLLVSSNAITTTVFTGIDSSNWEHYWFDMTPWSGQDITLTFKLSETAGFPPASALLDEVTIGAAHSDVWVDLSGGARVAHPGDQIDYQVDYGNHGGVPASATVITMTLPLGLNFVDASIPPAIIGNQLVWQVGDLPAGSVFDGFDMTLEVDVSSPMMQIVITNVEISTTSPELEKVNNFSESEIYLGYFQILPIIRR